ncbi:pinensin family lanthipeptide [Longimicrobium sp.]|uniref:pinensin family lanthipeptide n=1 Tax=Longimicrobium sp. TaxID=2029185 RepID=UPI002E37CE57|nr:pinensin family lanthipeptide [Longimicrobium sp.]HEX6040118.1 pinensin family lanthipeptide [Longimicrobium sp.]
MRKIQLNLDTLAVESFETNAVPAARGTVEGRQDEAVVFAITDLCQTLRCPTQYYSCAVQQSAPASCQYGCDCTVKGSPC